MEQARARIPKPYRAESRSHRLEFSCNAEVITSKKHPHRHGADAFARSNEPCGRKCQRCRREAAFKAYPRQRWHFLPYGERRDNRSVSFLTLRSVGMAQGENAITVPGKLLLKFTRGRSSVPVLGKQTGRISRLFCSGFLNTKNIKRPLITLVLKKLTFLTPKNKKI